jgi:hypothetical protein
MNFKKSLIPVALLVCMFLTGFTRSVAQDVQVQIGLPYSGNYNYWGIDFYSSTGEHYRFDTNDDTFESGVLCTIPAGIYEIDFNSGYSGGFDYGVTGPTYYKYHASGNSYNFYGAVIEEGTTIYIDEGY